MKGKINSSIIAAVVFVIVIFMGGILFVCMPDREFSPLENRLLEQSPEFTTQKYFDGRYAAKLDTYLNDQFPFRDSFIKIKSSVDVTAGKLESNGVYRCTDNYLMEDITVPSDSTVASYKRALKAFTEKYPDLMMTFLLAPNAANILSEKLPEAVETADQNKYMDDLFATVESYGITPIDVRTDLIRAKEAKQIYYKTDHHWTTDGAYVAYRKFREIKKYNKDISYKPLVVKNDFCGTLYSKSGFTNGEYDAITIYLPDNDENYRDSIIYYADSKVKTTSFYEKDNLKEKDAYTVFGGSNHPKYKIETPVVSQQNLLLIKDSYANSMIPFLSQHFRKIVVIDPRYFFDDIDDIITSEKISQVMFLYNANTFFADDSLSQLLSSSNE